MFSNYRINHYLNVCGDVQTAAMLGCAFSEKFDAYSKLTSGLKPSSNVGIPAGQAKGSVRTVQNRVFWYISCKWVISSTMCV